jgi:hypothetical protein
VLTGEGFEVVQEAIPDALTSVGFDDGDRDFGDVVAAVAVAGILSGEEPRLCCADAFTVLALSDDAKVSRLRPAVDVVPALVASEDFGVAEVGTLWVPVGGLNEHVRDEARIVCGGGSSPDHRDTVP